MLQVALAPTAAFAANPHENPKDTETETKEKRNAEKSRRTLQEDSRLPQESLVQTEVVILPADRNQTADVKGEE